jgi:hypothetical protein
MTKIIPLLVATVAVVVLILTNVNSVQTSHNTEVTTTLQIILDRLGEVEKRLKIKVPDKQRVVFSDGNGAQVVK